MSGLVAGILTAVALVMASGATAAVYEPTRRDDPEPGKCRPADCSLREAISAVNADPDRDTILLRRGTYELELPHAEDGFNNGSFDLLNSMTIRGRGLGDTVIDGNGLDQVMTSWGNGLVGSFKLEDLTLTGGRADVSQEDGGGILVGFEDRTALSRVAIIRNSAAHSGGGIAALENDDGFFGALTVKRSVIMDNGATIGGGIESNLIALTVKQTTIANNGAEEGAGLDLRPGFAPPVTRITSSTISGNGASRKAGGLLADGVTFGGGNFPDDPLVRINNSTVASNRASGDAGGVMADNLANVVVSNSTIARNRANNDGVGTDVGGGVYQHSDARFTIDDSVIAHNDDGAPGGQDDCSATQAFTGSSNVLSSETGCLASFTPPLNLYSAGPVVGELAENGGPTRTLALAPGSLAAGFATDCPRKDQRGALRRPVCDAGAFEENPKGRELGVSRSARR